MPRTGTAVTVPRRAPGPLSTTSVMGSVAVVTLLPRLSKTETWTLARVTPATAVTGGVVKTRREGWPAVTSKGALVVPLTPKSEGKRV